MKTDGDGSREGSAASASSRHRPHVARGVYCITRHAASRSDFEPSGKRGVSRFTPPRDRDSGWLGAISRPYRSLRVTAAVSAGEKKRR